MAATTIHSPVVSSEDITGTAVYDLQGHKVGKIDHLMIEKASGHVVCAVMTVIGFLGIGHSHREVPWSALSYSTKLHGFQLTVPPDAPEVTSLPS